VGTTLRENQVTTGAAPARRILIIKPSSLGDIVHALPVLAALRERYPSAHIAWLVGRGFAELLDGHPLLDEVIAFDRSRFGRMWRSPRIAAEFARFVLRLRRQRYELVVDLQGLFRSGFLAWTSGAVRRVGFAAARELAWCFYTQRVACPPDAVHAVERNCRLAAALGLDAMPPRFPLDVSPADTAAAHARLCSAAGRPVESFIAVIPGARWETKRWPAERFAALVEQLAADGAGPCVLLGAADERAAADAVERSSRTPIVNLAGQTSLRELCAVLALARCVVCNDSGPMHLAAALGRPVVAVFGPTDPQRTGPYSPAAHVIRHAIECAPCLERRCPLKHHDCMQQLPVDCVAAKVREALAAAGGAAIAVR
jgi:lipopolysaccharide heptosyltransferase I